ncbi:septum formation protein [Robbsia andropogonis]|uniref:Maf family protein n=1 Tax=Robbsia andropogonis TaxID=28092 RepID=UPI003D1B2C3E
MTSTPRLSDSAFLYLASQSPRRGQLLEQLGLSYRLLLPDADEDAEALEATRSGEHAHDYVMRVVQAKACAAAERLARRGWPSAAILCADTTVSLDGAILGKPADATEAVAILSRLSGRRHEVMTAVAVVPVPTGQATRRVSSTPAAPQPQTTASGPWFASTSTCTSTALSEAALPPSIRCVLSTSTVTFRTLDDADIAHYIASGEPFGKAGAYGIQGRAAAFIAHLDGSYSGVMGLPLFETASLLRDTAPMAYDVALSHRDSNQ